MPPGKFNRGPGSPWRRAMEARRGKPRNTPPMIQEVDKETQKQAAAKPPDKVIARPWRKGTGDLLDRAIADLLSDRELQHFSWWRGERSRFPERYR